MLLVIMYSLVLVCKQLLVSLMPWPGIAPSLEVFCMQIKELTRAIPT